MKKEIFKQEQMILEEEKTERKHSSIVSKIALAFCVLLFPILIFNVSIIVKGMLYPNEVPSFFGVMPMVVLSDSMNSERESIASGDMIFIKKINSNDVVVGDIVLFQEKTSLVVHRVVQIDEGNEGKQFITKGDANNTEDIAPVLAKDIIGIYTTKIPMIGHFVMFLRTPLGILVCIGFPTTLYLLYEGRQRKQEKQQYAKELLHLQEKVSYLNTMKETRKDFQNEKESK